MARSFVGSGFPSEKCGDAKKWQGGFCFQLTGNRTKLRESRSPVKAEDVCRMTRRFLQLLFVSPLK
jgi:hypothetical protein